MEFLQHAEEGLTQPLLKSTGSRNKSMEKTTFTFKVKNYSSLCKGIGVGETIESEPFKVGGHSWTIAFYPAGNNEHALNGGHVSLFLRRNIDQNQKAVDFVCSFTVLDQTSNRLDCRINERAMYRHVAALQSGQTSWGFPIFMKRETMESRSFGYLRGDCIKIRAELGVFVDRKQKLLRLRDHFVLFKVEDKQLYAEESLLAKRCPNLLHNAIPDLQQNVFEAMLWYIQKGKLHWEDKKAISDSRWDDPNSFALKMIEAAHHFNLKRLLQKCKSNQEALTVQI